MRYGLPLVIEDLVLIIAVLLLLCSCAVVMASVALAHTALLLGALACVPAGLLVWFLVRERRVRKKCGEDE